MELAQSICATSREATETRNREQIQENMRHSTEGSGESSLYNYPLEAIGDSAQGVVPITRQTSCNNDIDDIRVKTNIRMNLPQLRCRGCGDEDHLIATRFGIDSQVDALKDRIYRLKLENMPSKPARFLQRVQFDVDVPTKKGSVRKKIERIEESAQIPHSYVQGDFRGDERFCGASNKSVADFDVENTSIRNESHLNTERQRNLIAKSLFSDGKTAMQDPMNISSPALVIEDTLQIFSGYTTSILKMSIWSAYHEDIAAGPERRL